MFSIYSGSTLIRFREVDVFSISSPVNRIRTHQMYLGGYKTEGRLKPVEWQGIRNLFKERQSNEYAREINYLECKRE